MTHVGGVGFAGIVAVVHPVSHVSCPTSAFGYGGVMTCLVWGSFSLVGCLPLLLGLSSGRDTRVDDAWAGAASASWLMSEM
jgi:hypothetical protein